MMKKIVSALLLCCLLALPLGGVLAEDNRETVELDDFTMVIDSRMPGDLYEKRNTETYFQVYPAYPETGDSACNLNAVWMEPAQDGSFDPNAIENANNLNMLLLTNAFQQSVPARFEEGGLKVNRCEMVDRGFTSIGGRRAIYFVLDMEIDYSAMGGDFTGLVLPMYMKEYLVAGDFGTCIFAGVASTLDMIETCVDPLIDSIQWY